MNYYDVICDYVGRELTLDELEIWDDGDGELYIKKWNVDGVQKPTKQQVIDHYNSRKSEIDRDREIKNLDKKHKQKYFDYLFDQAKGTFQPYQDELAEINARYSG